MQGGMFSRACSGRRSTIRFDSYWYYKKERRVVEKDIRVEIETREEHHLLLRVLLLRSIRRALLKFGERTLATAGSGDFTVDDFFPDLGNLFLNDMGDNLNANSVAPVARMCFCPSCSKSW